MMGSTESSLLVGLVIVFFLLLFIIMALIIVKPESIPLLKKAFVMVFQYLQYAFSDFLEELKRLVSNII